MPFIIMNLDVDVSLLSEIEAQDILDAQSVEYILVGRKQPQSAAHKRPTKHSQSRRVIFMFSPLCL